MRIYIDPFDGWQSESDQDDEDVNVCDYKLVQRAAPKYKHLITIHAGKPKGSLKDALSVVGDEVKRLSLSEQELEKAATSHGTEVVRYISSLIDGS